LFRKFVNAHFNNLIRVFDGDINMAHSCKEEEEVAREGE
jgi:hypothetical protein